MNDYDKQKWFDLYRTALLELNRAAMTVELYLKTGPDMPYFRGCPVNWYY